MSVAASGEDLPRMHAFRYAVCTQPAELVGGEAVTFGSRHASKATGALWSGCGDRVDRLDVTYSLPEGAQETLRAVGEQMRFALARKVACTLSVAGSCAVIAHRVSEFGPDEDDQTFRGPLPV